MANWPHWEAVAVNTWVYDPVRDVYVLEIPWDDLLRQRFRQAAAPGGAPWRPPLSEQRPAQESAFDNGDY